jgi:hypothetical protein
MKHCLFCKSNLTGNRAKEHAIPAWLLQHLDLKDVSCAEIAYTKDGYLVESRAKLGSQSFLAGRVCKSCNNGWMSKLEGNIKPTLINLLDASQTLADLNDEQRFLLARWTVKTAYMINHTWKVPPIVPAKHLEQLFKGKLGLPDGVSVFAHQHPVSSAIGWMQGRDWVCAYLPSIEKDARQMHLRSYRLALQVGKLLLLVAHWPGRRWTYGMRNIIYNRIWPTGQCLLQGNVPFTELRQKEWEKAPYALREFYDSLEAVHTEVVQRASWGKTRDDNVPVSLVPQAASMEEFMAHMNDLNQFLHNPSQEWSEVQRFVYNEHKEVVYTN